MKSSYKLFGTLWDQIPEIENPLVIVKEKFPCVNNYNVEYNLFDVDSYERKISLKEILTCESDLTFKKIIEKLKSCKVIYIILDYEPQYKTKVITTFLKKRTRQIYSMMSKQIPSAQIILVKSN